MKAYSVTLQIAADHPALAGHFPGSPIIPGVVLLDEALHAIERAQPVAAATLIWELSTVKFHHVALPGDTLQLDIHWQADAGANFQMRSATALIASGSVRRRAKIRAVVGAR